MRIRAYFLDLLRGPDPYLTEWDSIGASEHGESVFREYTDMNDAECLDKALDIAFQVSDELRRTMCLS